ncbi:MATE family efflux transporter [Lachnoclostridium sp. Marseille-P6806]|uniref:MATE family efflux transporter n=1 Tax=Lachnoclostridium sp. Marseille-P6806 TaxID=2364793 RepID=UPI001030CCBB|nr:MATE family efflux transporter [Lachnoclostridium sp. Marseille-P6806]
MTETAQEKNAIITGTIWKQLLLFFFPLLGGTFFQILYNTVDAIVVGRFVGKEALSAVGGSTGILISLFVGLFVGISAGSSVVVAQFVGAGRREEVHRAVHTSMALALIGGVVLNVTLLLFSETMLRAMGTPEDIAGLSLLYMRIYACGMLGNMIYNFGASILRGAGNSKAPFCFLVAGALANIILDLVTVMIFHMGVWGVALATILSQYVSAAATLFYMIRSKEIYRLELRRIRVEREYFIRIFRIGVPAALRSLMYSFSNVLIQRCINGFGTDTVAAWTVWERIDAIYWMIINSLGIAVTTFIGQNYGAGRYDRVRRCVREGMVISAGFTFFMIAVFLTQKEPFLHLFTGDPAVMEIGREVIEFMAPMLIAYISIEILSSSLQGMGAVVIPTIITIGGVCLLRIVWIYTVVPRWQGLHTILYSYPFSWLVSSAAFWIYYEYFVRKKRIYSARG